MQKTNVASFAAWCWNVANNNMTDNTDTCRTRITRNFSNFFLMLDFIKI